MLVGLGATVNVAKPKPGSSVAIFGLGAVGLAVCQSNAFVCEHCSYYANGKSTILTAALVFDQIIGC